MKNSDMNTRFHHSTHGIARFSFLALISLLISCGAGEQQEPESRAKAPVQPNIVWISVEDISPHIGAYGDELALTPNIDRLANSGVRYINAFSTAGVCAPSRAAIITGMYQTSIGAHHMRTSHVAPGLPTPYATVPPPHVKAFTEYLRAAGYYTSNNIKTDYQFSDIRNPRDPITAWDDCATSAHWRKRPDKSQPFFSVFNFTTTHESGNWEKENYQGITAPFLVKLPPYYPDTKKVRAEMARMYDNINRMDQRVGQVLQQLEEDGLTENTVIFFWSDHGDGLPRAKRWLYDSGIHVPLIVRWPGQVPPGTVNRELVSLVDLAPTVLTMAGVPVPDHMQGYVMPGFSFTKPRDYVFAARDRIDESYDRVRAVRDKRFKYIRNFDPQKPYILPVAYRDKGGIMQELLRLNASGNLDDAQKLWFRQTRPAEELYDITSDPHELNNLAEDAAHQETVERMRTRLDKWMTDSGDMGHIPEAEMVETMWPGKQQPQTAMPGPAGVLAQPEMTLPMDQLKDGLLTLTCETEGASIAYTTEAGPRAHWRLYNQPLNLATGTSILRARAIRYGFKESPELTIRFE